MIADKVISLANRRFDAILPDREDQIGYEIARIKSEAAAAGAFQSGRLLLRVSRLLENEIAIRSALAWQALRQCVVASSHTFGADEVAQAKDWVSRKISTSAEDMESKWRGDKSLSFSRMIPIDEKIQQAMRRSFDKTAAEIDLFALAMERPSNQTAPPTAGVVIHSVNTIQALQTGSESIANVSQTITQEDRATLLSALETVRVALEALDRNVHGGRDEILDMINETIGEVGRNPPSGLKLASNLSAIGQSISTVAALKPAYDTLKGVAALVGVTLP